MKYQQGHHFLLNLRENQKHLKKDEDEKGIFDHSLIQIRSLYLDEKY